MYKFNSLGVQTNFLLDSSLAEITEKDEYFVIKTPLRPNYFWGNYILMKSQPSKGCINRWKDIFESEIGEIKRLGYCAITFDLTQAGIADTSDFLQQSFVIDIDKILMSKKVFAPKKYNPNVLIKEYDLTENIEDYVDIHLEANWDYGSLEEQKSFIKSQAMAFSNLVNKGLAKRFAAYIDNKMVGDLGIYWKDDVIRFNNVSTHEDHKRLGVCSTLVYEVSKKLLENNPQAILVMQADEDYYAAKIYESIGFIEQEKIISLEWKDNAKFGAQKP